VCGAFDAGFAKLLWPLVNIVSESFFAPLYFQVPFYFEARTMSAFHGIDGMQLNRNYIMVKNENRMVNCCCLALWLKNL